MHLAGFLTDLRHFPAIEYLYSSYAGRIIQGVFDIWLMDGDAVGKSRNIVFIPIVIDQDLTVSVAQ